MCANSRKPINSTSQKNHLLKIRISPKIGDIRILKRDEIMATATELNKQPGKYLNQAMREPVVIEKSGQPIVVMVAYERFLQLEDAYWGELASDADKESPIGTDATMDFLTGDD